MQDERRQQEAGSRWSAPAVLSLVAVPLAVLTLAGTGTSQADVDAPAAADHGAMHHDPVKAEAAIAAWVAAGRPDGAGTLSLRPRQEEVDTTITVRTVGEVLQFTPTRISVKQGLRVRLVYVNGGTLPHNLVIVAAAADIDALGSAAYSAGDDGFVPVKTHKDDMLAWTPLASPDQTVETTFVVPAAGEYTFVCLFPGHYNMMFGTFRSLN